MFMQCSLYSSPSFSSFKGPKPLVPFTECRSSSPPSSPLPRGISYYRINYQELARLGRGAGGETFLCRNNIDEDLYAVKKIRTSVPEAARLKEEAVILRHLDHPNIVRYYQSWIEDTPIDEPFDIFDEDEASLSGTASDFEQKEGSLTLFIAMQYCPLTLRMAIEAGLDGAADVSNLFYQLVKGVHYIHKKGMMHRDLNPNNVFISSDGNIKIGDFGCSTWSQRDFCHKVGTSFYRAPEIDSEDHEHDNRVDIYSLGMILFEMLYKMNTQMERHQVLKQLLQLVFPPGFEQDHPFAAQLIKIMLSPNPDDRMDTTSLLRTLKQHKTSTF